MHSKQNFMTLQIVVDQADMSKQRAQPVKEECRRYGSFEKNMSRGRPGAYVRAMDTIWNDGFLTCSPFAPRSTWTAGARTDRCSQKC